MLPEFKKFIMRGNVLDLAIGVIIGAAFGKIVASMVNDVLMPMIGLAVGKVDFSNLFISLDRSKSVDTLAAAKAAKVPVLAYGVFINTIIEFLIVAFVIFLIVKQVNRFKKPEEAPAPTKDCPECCTAIPLAASHRRLKIRAGMVTQTLRRLSEAANRVTWSTPPNLPVGTYTYFCRIHPFMRGSFRVVR